MKINLFNLLTLFFIASLLCLSSCTSNGKTETATTDTAAARKQINALLDSFNVAAARADYTTYFNFYTDDAIFTGTDATERWDKNEFMQWAKPIFDKGRTWDFTALERHIYFDKTGTLAWFDELLNTQMKICRGSGVVVLQNGTWKVQEYVLSVTIPNALVDSVVNLKSAIDDSLMTKSLP